MYPFEPGCTHLLAGQSGSGKTTYIFNVMKHQQEMFGDFPPQKIKYYYGIYKPLFDKMKETIPNISFQLGLPSLQELEEFTDPDHHTMIIIDDLMTLAKDSSIVEDIFCQISHHKFVTCYLLVQNLYAQGKKMRTISLNAKYMTIFRNPRDAYQLQILGRQLFPGNSHALVEAFEDCLKHDTFAYLVIDLTPHTPQEQRVRTHIFPAQLTIVYVPQ